MELEQRSSTIGARTKELDNWSSNKEAWHGFGEVENVENVGNSVVLWPIKVGAGRKSRKTRCFLSFPLLSRLKTSTKGAPTKELENWSSSKRARELELQQKSSTIGAPTKGLDNWNCHKGARELELQQKGSTKGSPQRGKRQRGLQQERGGEIKVGGGKSKYTRRGQKSNF